MSQRLKSLGLISLTLLLSVGIPSLPTGFNFTWQLAQAQTPEARLAEAERLGLEAFQLYQKSQYREALEKLQQGLSICEGLSTTATGEVQKSAYECKGIALLFMGTVYIALGDYSKALNYLQQTLAIQREIGNRELEGTTLNNIGQIYVYLGDFSKALDYFEQALAIHKENSNRQMEGTILNNIGQIYLQRGDYNQALENFQQALAIVREIGTLVEGEIRFTIRSVEGTILNNIGQIHIYLGDYSQALDYFGQALVIAKEIGDRNVEGTILSNIGQVYVFQGDYNKALDYFQQGLKITQEIGNRQMEGATLSAIGQVYANQGDYSQALNYFEQALAIMQEIGDRSIEGATLSNIGLVYTNLGDYDRALNHLQQALVIFQEIGSRQMEGTALNNIGLAYDDLGDGEKALNYYQQALVIFQEIGNRQGEGTTLSNLGLVYSYLGDDRKALDYYEQALVIVKEIGDRQMEGATLNNLGLLYHKRGDYSQALNYYQQGLAIVKEIGNRQVEATNLSNIGVLLDTQKQPQLAIIFLKQSVNVFETIRKDIKGLSKEQQESYVKTVEGVYRYLADLLLKQDRILEAQRVLDLLKVQELDDYFQDVRGNEDTKKGIPNLPPEQQLTDSYETLLAKAIETGKELAQLHQLKTKTPAQEQRIAELEKVQSQLIDDFNTFIESDTVQTLITQLSPQTREPDLVDEMGRLIGLQDNLAALEQNAVLLYPLILDDRIELILTTPNSPPIRRTVKVSKEKLNSTIIAFRQALQDSNSDAKTPAKQLYEWLIKPLESDLKAADAKTIIYAPDGQLRYIPLAALYDGQQWLIQKYRINNITAYSLTDFTLKPAAQLHILAGAFVTGSYNFTQGGEEFAFSGLKYAGIEVDNLTQTVANTTKLLDNDFNPDNTTPKMNSYTVVHLATHAAVVVGKADESFILFGNGTPVTIKDVKKWNLKNVELVVLSACETGLGGNLGTGVEILGLGYQIERAGAKAVIASLWTVDDGGTQMLMSAFYTLLQSGKVSKAEALRQAQIAMITGDETILSQQRGGLVVVGVDLPKTGDLSHSYYWAPFILIGNGL